MGEVEGLERLRAKMRKMAPDIKAAMRVEMEKAATDWVAQMRRLVPRRSGELAATIGWTWGAPPEGSVSFTAKGRDMVLTLYAGSAATIVTNSHGGKFQLAKLQEFGTKAMQANPFFYPVYRAGRGKARRAINAAARKAIKQAWEQ